MPDGRRALAVDHLTSVRAYLRAEMLYTKSIRFQPLPIVMQTFTR